MIYMYIIILFLFYLSLPKFIKLTLEAPIRTAADDSHKHFFFSEKIRLDVSSESSARQRIHMKYQALFSSNDKSKKLKCCLLQFLFGALRVKPLHLSFQIKLVNINVSDIADGKPSIVLGLIWTIILYFQVGVHSISVNLVCHF